MVQLDQGKKNTKHTTGARAIKIQITFHSYQAKKSFVKVNRFADTEIISQTPGSITIIDSKGFDFQNSPFVYSVKKVE